MKSFSLQDRQNDTIENENRESLFTNRGEKNNTVHYKDITVHSSMILHADTCLNLAMPLDIQ